MKILNRVNEDPPQNWCYLHKAKSFNAKFFYQNCCKYKQILFCRLGEVLEIVDDLVIDIPKIWTYIAEILCK